MPNWNRNQRRVDDKALHAAINAGRGSAHSVFKQIARLLAIVLAVGVGFGILLLVNSREIKPPTSAQQSQKPPTNSEPLNDAQREPQATAPASASAPPPPDFRGVKWGSRPALWMQKIGGPSGEDKISTWKKIPKNYRLS